MFKKNPLNGVTLVELLVVVLIIGIITLLGVPQYQKSVENSDADQAIATLQIIGPTNRLYNLDQGSYTAGYINSCQPAACPLPSTTASVLANKCNLINCQYMAQQNFGSAQYD